MTKTLLRGKARKLRGIGFGIKTIAYKLDVSSSTVSRWCKDVKLSPRQIEILEKRARDPFYGRRFKNIQRQIKKRLDNIEKLKRKGIEEVGRITRRELFLIGIALYWAEGFKKDKRLGFANSDPVMIQLFIKWLTECCCVPKEQIRLRIGLNISHKKRVKLVEDYWTNITTIPTAQFQKPYFQKFTWKKEFPKPEEYFGVLRIRANKQLALFRKIHGWIEGIKRNT